MFWTWFFAALMVGIVWCLGYRSGFNKGWKIGIAEGMLRCVFEKLDELREEEDEREEATE